MTTIPLTLLPSYTKLPACATSAVSYGLLAFLNCVAPAPTPAIPGPTTLPHPLCVCQNFSLITSAIGLALSQACVSTTVPAAAWTPIAEAYCAEVAGGVTVIGESGAGATLLATATLSESATATAADIWGSVSESGSRAHLFPVESSTLAPTSSTMEESPLSTATSPPSSSASDVTTSANGAATSDALSRLVAGGGALVSAVVVMLALLLTFLV